MNATSLPKSSIIGLNFQTSNSLLHKRTTSHISYQSLSHASQSIAAFFQQQSFKTGDSVALMLGQETAWWYSLAGLMRSGIAAVPCPNYSRVVIWLIDSMILAFVESSPPQKSKTGLIASSQSALRSA